MIFGDNLRVEVSEEDTDDVSRAMLSVVFECIIIFVFAWFCFWQKKKLCKKKRESRIAKEKLEQVLRIPWNSFR